MNTTKEVVPRFWLQPTASFMGGAPQREEYLDDQAFLNACLVYEEEWRAQYECGETNCQNRDCPQHWPMKGTDALSVMTDGIRLGKLADELESNQGIVLPYNEGVSHKAKRLAAWLTRGATQSTDNEDPGEPSPYPADQLIELPIASNYVAGWGLWEAVREIWQNALDQQESSGRASELSFRDGQLHIGSFGVLKMSSLVFGNSTKAGDSKLRGKFGEGYKLALLALLRAGYQVTIFNQDEVWTPSFKHSETFETEILTIKVATSSPTDSKRVVFEISGIAEKDWEAVEANILPDSIPHGILSDPRHKGRVYVGGLYVCTFEEFECGYSFRPDQVALDRDRGLMSTYELQTLTAELWASRDVGFTGMAGAVSLVKSEKPDTAYLSVYAKSSSPIVAAVAADFEQEHGAAAVPVTTQEEVQRAQAAGVKWVMVPFRVKEILKLVKNWFVPSVKTPLERLKDLLKSAQHHMTDEQKKELADIIRVMEGK